ncbi:hypothetical protein [Ferrimonas aestuarii]|nr:hypothetical protein [Ferrimonas aestuarii]
MSDLETNPNDVNSEDDALQQLEDEILSEASGGTSSPNLGCGDPD